WTCSPRRSGARVRGVQGTSTPGDAKMRGARLGGAIALAGTLGAAAIAHAQAPAPAQPGAPPIVQAAPQAPSLVLTPAAAAATPDPLIPPVSACASASLVAIDAASTRRATHAILCLLNGARTA